MKLNNEARDQVGRCPHDYALTDGTVADWCPECRTKSETTFPDRLRRLIKDSDMTNAEVAMRAGITPQYLCDLTYGRRDAVTFAVAESLASALECDPCYLNAPVRVIVPYSHALDYRRGD